MLGFSVCMIDMPELSEVVRYATLVGAPVMGSLAFAYINRRCSKKKELKRQFGLPDDSNPKYSKLISVIKAFRHNYEYLRTQDKNHIKKVPRELQEIIDSYEIFKNLSLSQTPNENAVDRFKASKELHRYLLSA